MYMKYYAHEKSTRKYRNTNAKWAASGIASFSFQGLSSLRELNLDHALGDNFTNIDPSIWNGLDSITDLHLENSQGITAILASTFNTIGDTLQVSISNRVLCQKFNVDVLTMEAETTYFNRISSFKLTR